MLSLFQDAILYIIDNKDDLTPERVCAIYFQAQKCVDPDAKKWIIPLPPPPKKKEKIKYAVSTNIQIHGFSRQHKILKRLAATSEQTQFFVNS